MTDKQDTWQPSFTLDDDCDPQTDGEKDNKISQLQSNPNVESAKISPHGELIIKFTDTFKNKVLDSYYRGDSPVETFKLAGLGPDVIGWNRIRRSLFAWRGPTRSALEQLVDEKTLEIEELRDKLRKLEDKEQGKKKGNHGKK